MILKQIRSYGLAHYSYFIGSDGKAAVIDPRRDSKIYSTLAQENQMDVQYIFETHRNEDYTIGSLELSRMTGADIYHGPKTEFSYGTVIDEKESYPLGFLTLNVLKTPGHTEDSICITVKEKKDTDNLMMFTGDTLFAGGTGRIDLYGTDKKEEMANKLYHSLHHKILLLDETVVLCPAHGKGSVCGRGISNLIFTTLGYEKRHNKQLSLKKEEFITYKVNEHHYIPPYFKRMESYNMQGPPILPSLPFLKPLFTQDIRKLRNTLAQLVDIRSPAAFASGHVPGSIHIWREGIPSYAGWFLSYDHPIILIDDFNMDLPLVVRYLIRLGFSNIKGYLYGGFSSWYKHQKPIGTIDTWTVSELNKRLDNHDFYLLDVRDETDWKNNGYINTSKNIYVGLLPEYIHTLPKDKKIVIYCDTGFKTSIAASILKNNGVEDVVNVLGGFNAWKQAGFPINTI